MTRRTSADNATPATTWPPFGRVLRHGVGASSFLLQPVKFLVRLLNGLAFNFVYGVFI
jgi:hypothetical protein